MQATNWIDRIADESNLWLAAVKAEEGGELDRAALLFLKDASESMNEGKPLKAALSCSCAATCVGKLGSRLRARQLYAESAQIYLEKARAMAGVSVREFLWCLRESYRAFQHANMREKAEELRRYYSSLAGRVDPFIFADALDVSEAVPADNEVGEEAFEEDPVIVQEIERFLRPRREGYRRMGAPDPRKTSAPRRRPLNYEASVINQLG
jgi:hypothetical protein